jgi:excinuclease ABC subunit C
VDLDEGGREQQEGRREQNARRREDAGSVEAPKLAGGEYAFTRTVAEDTYESILLPHTSHILQLLQRVRDEAHRFAITYQTLLRGKRQTTSLLDEIPGVGPATRKQLIRRFGSVQGVKQATLEEVAALIGPAKAAVVKEHLGTTRPPEAAEASAE